MSLEEKKGVVSYERLLQILKQSEYYRCKEARCNGVGCERCIQDTLGITTEEYKALFEKK